MSTLRKNYREKQLQREHLLHEGIFDAFTNNSQNVTVVRNALQQTKSVAQTYGMKNIMTAVTAAEQKFEQSIANKSKSQAPTLSYILTFSDIMSDFFRELDQWIMQLPSVSQAVEASNDPANAQKTLKDLVGGQGDKVSPVITLSSIIQKQFDKSAGGFLKNIGRLFKTGNLTTSAQALKFVGLDSQKAAEDILNISVSKYNQLLQASKRIPPVQINAQATNPESGSTQTTQSKQSQSSQTTAPSQQSSPTQQANATTGNAQVSQKPSPEDAQKRDAGLQGAIKNRNAFNTQVLSNLSNDEVRSDLLKIAQSLGINLG